MQNSCKRDVKHDRWPRDYDELTAYVKELCGYLSNLFGIRVCPTNSVAPNATGVFLIGAPDSNGKILTLTAAGKARLVLQEFNGITNIHASYQLVIRFNPDHQYPEYNPADLPQLEFYANSGLDP